MKTNMKRNWPALLLAIAIGVFAFTNSSLANPPNGKAILEAFYWDAINKNFQTNDDGTGGWYTYLAKLSPRLRDMGFDGIWIPPESKGAAGRSDMGYAVFDAYDLGQKFQKGTTGTRFGDQDDFLRLVAVAHACGLEVYSDDVLNHVIGGTFDPNAPNESRTKFKTFQYHGFTGANSGRWPKTWLDFHPNPHHGPGGDDWRTEIFAPDVCYHGRCCDNDCEHAGTYMRDHAREWFVWFKKQSDVDGFRFDAVKHFPPEVVEDLLYNAMDKDKPESQQRQYFAVGEFPAGRNEQQRLDDWANETKNRCGTFDFAFREALLDMVNARGFFDMGSLPNFQQKNRQKTVPFVNNHDTFRGLFADSSGNGKADHTGNVYNSDELMATIDPDSDWAKVAYAAMVAIDGSPQFYYEDLFKNDDPATRDKADPKTYPTRPYVENLVWCHQKLNFKDGAYKVRYQGSQDLLVIERSGKAVIGLNDNGVETLSVTIDTDFGPNVRLHDYSGSTNDEPTTNREGRLFVRVPPKSYCVLGPPGIGGGFIGHPRRTTQEFQMDDDLGDSDPKSLGYGGKLVPNSFRTAGSIWVKEGSNVKVWVYADQTRDVSLRILKPNQDGKKAGNQGQFDARGLASPNGPLFFEFVADREGYYQLTGKLSELDAQPVRNYIKVEYEAPAESEKF